MSLLLQNEELNLLIQAQIENYFNNSSKDFLFDFLPFLMELDSDNIQEFGYNLGKRWLETDFLAPNDRLKVLSFLFYSPKHKKEILQQIKEFLNNKYFTFSYNNAILNSDHPELQQCFIDHFIIKHGSSNSAPHAFFMCFFEKEIPDNMEKGLKGIHRFLNSNEREEDKFDFIARFTSPWSLSESERQQKLKACSYLQKDPLFEKYYKKIFLSPFFIRSKQNREELNEICDQLIEMCRSPDFDKKWGEHIVLKLIPLLLEKGLSEKLVELAEVLSNVDFGEAVYGQMASISVWNYLFRNGDNDRENIIQKMMIHLPTLSIGEVQNSMEILRLILRNEVKVEIIQRLMIHLRILPIHDSNYHEILEFTFENGRNEDKQEIMKIMRTHLLSLSNQELGYYIPALKFIFRKSENEDNSEIVEKTKTYVSSVSMLKLSELSDIFHLFPDSLKNQIVLQVCEFFIPRIQELATLLPGLIPHNNVQEKKRVTERRERILHECQPLFNVFDSFVDKMTEGLGENTKTKKAELLALLVENEKLFQFSSHEKIKLFACAYKYTDASPSYRHVVLNKMKECFLDGSLPLRDRSDHFYKFIRTWKDSGSYYDQAFATILEIMLEFEMNITDQGAVVDNVHDPVFLVPTNWILKNLLENEREERRFLTNKQKTEMLDDLDNILENLSEPIRLLLEASAQVHDAVSYIVAAKERLGVMRAAKDSIDPRKREHWDRTAEDEIVILDHNQKFVSQGRALQLVYDAMMHVKSQLRGPEVVEEAKGDVTEKKFNKYEDILVALIQILGTPEAVGACPSGAIGGLLRATKSLYNEAPRNEKFGGEANDRDQLQLRLEQLKTLMVSLLDQWRVNPNVFNYRVKPRDYPMLKGTNFIGLITQGNRIMEEFFKVLKTINWEPILRDLNNKPLRELFQQHEFTEKEAEIFQDLHTLLIIPSIRAFVYGEYKPFLANESLKMEDCVAEIQELKIINGDYTISTHNLPPLPKRYYIWANNHWEVSANTLGWIIDSKITGIPEGDIFINDPQFQSSFENGTYTITSNVPFWSHICATVSCRKDDTVLVTGNIGG